LVPRGRERVADDKNWFQQTAPRVDDAYKLLFVLAGTKGLFTTLPPHPGLVIIGAGAYNGLTESLYIT
jgi:hypothetical protein